MSAFINDVNKPIKYKDSEFYCFDCKKIVKGTGYLIPELEKAYCKKHYLPAFNKWFRRDK